MRPADQPVERPLPTLLRVSGRPIGTEIAQSCRRVLDAWWALRQSVAALPYLVRKQDMKNNWALAEEDRHLRVGFSPQRVWGIDWPSHNPICDRFLQSLDELLATFERQGKAKAQAPAGYAGDTETKQLALTVLNLLHQIERHTNWHPAVAPLSKDHLWFGDERLDWNKRDEPPQREGAPHDLLRWPKWVILEVSEKMGNTRQPLRDHLAARYLDSTADFRWWVTRYGGRSISEEGRRLFRHPESTPAVWSHLVSGMTSDTVYVLTSQWTAPGSKKRQLPPALAHEEGVSWLCKQMTGPRDGVGGLVAEGLMSLASWADRPRLETMIEALSEHRPEALPKLLELPAVRRRIQGTALRKLLLHHDRAIRESALRVIGEQPERLAKASQKKPRPQIG